MRPENVNWQSGRVAFWELDFLDPSQSLLGQIDNLKEDLAQIEYPGGVIVDIGWYPSFSREGRFIVRVVLEGEWDEPIFEEEQLTTTGLLACLPNAVRVAETHVTRR